MSDEEDIKLKIEDSDFGMGGIDRFNSETGKTEIIRQPETDRPFTIGDYNNALADAQKKQENIMSEETQQVKRADMINAQNKATEKQQVDTGEEVPKNSGGIEIAMRPKVAVNIMRCQIPTEVTSELNQHIEDVLIPNNVDHSKGLVGQIRQHERSAQLTFPHEGDEVGEMFSGVLQRLAKVKPQWKVCGLYIVIVVTTILYMTMAQEHLWVYRVLCIYKFLDVLQL